MAIRRNLKCSVEKRNNQTWRQHRYGRRQRGKIKNVSMALRPNKETETEYFQQKGSKWRSGKKDYK